MTEATADRTEQFKRSTLQHGPLSDRVYLMGVHTEDAPELLTHAEALSQTHGYGKIIAKVGDDLHATFHQAGYRAEGKIPRYDKEGRTAWYMAKYARPERQNRCPKAAGQIDEIIGEAQARGTRPRPLKPLQPNETIRACTPADTEAMAEVFADVFASYPFPIDDPAFLQRMMQEKAAYYFGIHQDDQLVALSSAEVDDKNGAVEMTDFATRPSMRGRGLARHLLAAMESAMTAKGYRTAFTIARAVSRGMNYVFADQAYAFGGTLHNNTNIGGAIESMNIWHKQL